PGDCRCGEQCNVADNLGRSSGEPHCTSAMPGVVTWALGQSCSPPDRLCLGPVPDSDMVTGSCVALCEPCDVSNFSMECDGQEDCPEASTCCADVAPSGDPWIHCTTNCPSGRNLCNDNTDCPSGAACATPLGIVVDATVW